MDNIASIHWDRKGRLICPVCRIMVRSGPDPANFLNVGVGHCQQGHPFMISRESAVEINTLWDKLIAGDRGLTRDFLKNLASPDDATKSDEKSEGGIILPPGA